jgi:hypothetical protein
MAMEKRTIKVIIDKQGAYTVEAGEGFNGQSCVEKTKNVELLLGEGATEVANGKTSAFYDPDGDNPISINLGN